jgi:hypothetical protein
MAYFQMDAKCFSLARKRESYSQCRRKWLSVNLVLVANAKIELER